MIKSEESARRKYDILVVWECFRGSDAQCSDDHQDPEENSRHGGTSWRDCGPVGHEGRQLYKAVHLFFWQHDGPSPSSFAERSILSRTFQAG